MLDWYGRRALGRCAAGPSSTTGGRPAPSPTATRLTNEVAFRALAADIAAAEADPFLVLRSIRLTPGRAAELLATLRAIAEQAEDDDAADQSRYGLLLGLYQPGHAPGLTNREP